MSVFVIQQFTDKTATENGKLIQLFKYCTKHKQMHTQYEVQYTQLHSAKRHNQTSTRTQAEETAT
jgi:hypothetical protein